MKLLFSWMLIALLPNAAFAKAVTLTDVSKCLRSYVDSFDGSVGVGSERLRRLLGGVVLDGNTMRIEEPLTGACSDIGPGRIELLVSKRGVEALHIISTGDKPRFVDLIQTDNQMRLHQQLEKTGVGLITVSVLPTPSAPIYYRVFRAKAFIREEFFWGGHRVQD